MGNRYKKTEFSENFFAWAHIKVGPSNKTKYALGKIIQDYRICLQKENMVER